MSASSQVSSWIASHFPNGACEVKETGKFTSAGNEEQSEKGKKILINSVIGLVVIILASAIVRIIAGLITGGQ